MAGDREQALEVFSAKELRVKTIRGPTGLAASEFTIGSDFVLTDGVDMRVGSSSGTTIATTASEKISFHGSTPIVQAILATGSTNDQIITALQALGLVKQS